MNQAFVLAAGLGTRLRPLTEFRPKPLVPICGVPLMSYTLALCARHGIERAVVNAHWLADQVEAWEGVREGVRVSISTERPEILGTGGGLKRVADQLAQRFVVLNGDILHDVDLTLLLEAVPDGGGAMALRPSEREAPRYGVVAADDTDTIVALTSLARATPEGPVRSDTHFTGIHALDRAVLERVPDGFACIVRTAYTELVPLRRVRGLRYGGPWLDAGDPAAYLEANLSILRGEVQLALDPWARAAAARGPDGRLHGATLGASVQGSAWVGHGVALGSQVTLHDSVVGERAVVPDGVHLTRCVVWDGCEVPSGQHTDVIVHPGGVLQI